MLPIRDDNPTRLTPFVTWSIIAICAYVFFVVQPQTDVENAEFMYAQATIPCEITTGDPLTITEISSGDCQREAGSEVFPEKSVVLSLLAAIFMHGSIGHLIGNLWVLFIFGNNIEDEMGHVPYIAFYVIGGVAASLSHVLFNPGSTIPVVGASGAIAAVMGAYLVLHPKARVTSIIPPLFFWPFRVPAFVFLGIWFITQFGFADTDTNIAWEAHVGGFVVGVAVALWMRHTQRRERIRVQAERSGFSPSHGPA